MTEKSDLPLKTVPDPFLRTSADGDRYYAMGEELEYWKYLAKRLLVEHIEAHGNCSGWPNAPLEPWVKEALSL